MTKLNGPVLIELDDTPETITPASAPVVPDLEGDPVHGRAMQTLVAVAAHRPSVLGRLFWAAALTLVMAVVSVGAWDFVLGLLSRNIWLGRGALVVVAVLGFAALGIALKEWVALVRLKRVDKLRRDVTQVAAGDDPVPARRVVDRLAALYHGRAEMRWALDRLAQQQGDILDADGLIGAAEQMLMPPLDGAARREVEAAARQVATVTAIVPLALADVVTALVANMRMVRRVAEIYGGRAGMFGSWRLMKTVMVHLVATGAVAVGDDLIGSILGGGLLSRVSRRFGEGVVNGALTARVGVAAMDVCRPMPFQVLARPKVSGLVKNALAGVFGKAG